MAILDLQQRARELGRIRLGQKGDRGQPEKLDRLRITSASRDLIDKVAGLYGGTVNPWTPRGGTGQYEVIITATRVPILVPPQPITQWMETWTGGGCVHRCDGRTNVLTAELCDDDDPDHVAAKPTTRLNVILRDVEGLGVFRLESHGWNAAAELPMAAMFLAAVGGYVEAHLGIEERVSKKVVNGRAQTNRFMVPVIEVDVTPAQLLAGGAAVAQITHSTPQAAIESGRAQVEQTPDETPRVDVAARMAECTTGVELRDLWRKLRTLDPATLSMDPEQIAAAMSDRAREIDAQPDGSGDTDAAWQQCLAAAGRLDPPWTLQETVDGFAERNKGLHANDATVAQLAEYAAWLRDGAVRGAA